MGPEPPTACRNRPSGVGRAAGLGFSGFILNIAGALWVCVCVCCPRCAYLIIAKIFTLEYVQQVNCVVTFVGFVCVF